MDIYDSKGFLRALRSAFTITSASVTRCLSPSTLELYWFLTLRAAKSSTEGAILFEFRDVVTLLPIWNPFRHSREIRVFDTPLRFPGLAPMKGKTLDTIRDLTD
jgi:hypothetical protein